MIIYPFVASGAADIVLVRFYLLYYLRHCDFYFKGVIQYYILSFGNLTESTTANKCYAKDTPVSFSQAAGYIYLCFIFYLL